MMTRRQSLAFFVMFMLAAPAAAQTANRIDSYIKPLAAAQQFSGVVVASHKGKIIYAKAFGMAQAEHSVPNRIDTVFGIASVTKPMTKVIALRLIEEGKLGLQDNLRKWLPDFPEGEKITIEMLMNHRSGIPHRGTKPEEESLRYTAADMVEKAKLAPLLFRPGAQESYSSLGYSVLARVLELASGKDFAELLQEYVFKPAAMNESFEFDGEKLIARRAQDYLLEPGGFVHTPLMDYSFLVGAGSVFSTAGDVFKFGKAIVDGTFGPGVKKALTENGDFWENGESNGFRCYVELDTEKGFGFVVISNLQSGANSLLVHDLPTILQGKPVAPPKPPTFSINHISKEQAQEYVGRYKFPEFTNTVHLEGNQLFSGDSKVFRIGNDVFYRFADYATLHFVRDSDGKIKQLEWSGIRFKGTGIRQQPQPLGHQK